MKFFGGKLKLDLSVWDITKSVIAIIVLVYAINFMGTVEKFFNAPINVLDKTEITKIAEGVYKARIAQSDKELKDTIKELKDTSVALKDALDNDEKVKAIGQVVARIEDNTKSLAGDFEEFKGRPSATLATALVDFKDSVGKEYTVATARYSPNAKGDQWSFNTWPRTFHTNIILSQEDNGPEVSRVEMWTESDWEKVKDKKGKSTKINVKHPLKMPKFSWVMGEVKEKKFRFAPRLGFTGTFGTDAIMPALDYSLWSYGRTKRDMTWRFFDLSAGGNKEDLMVAITPFSYNIGETLPVIENVFFGPTVGILLDEQEYTYGLSISIPL